jgi:chromosomal replication initiation ATPase DnaA
VKDNEYRAEMIALQESLPRRPFFVADLIQATAIFESIPVVMFMGAARGERFSLPRHRIWWISRNELGATYSQLGRLFDRDHTTCRSGVARYESAFLDMEIEELIRHEIKKIAGEIFRGERPLKASDDEIQMDEVEEEATAEDAE